MESQLDTTPGFSDKSNKDEHDTAIPIRRSGRQMKNQGPRRYGDPIKHSVQLICLEADIKDLNKAALEVYRPKLAIFETHTNKPTETKMGLFERHNFRRKFGYASLDMRRSWNAPWRLPLRFESTEEEEEGK